MNPSMSSMSIDCINMDRIKTVIDSAQQRYVEVKPALETLKTAGILRTWQAYDFLCSKPQQHERGPGASLETVTTALSSGYNGVLYVHVPFCEELCRFCSYELVRYTPDSPIDQYLAAVEKELRLYANITSSLQATHIYIGGGTPSVLSPRHIEDLFTVIRRYADVLSDAEITFEVSPISLETDGPAKLTMLQDVGVTRISMGVQSFDPQVLAYAARQKSTEAVVFDAVKKIRAADFHNCNIDLIYGLPHQTLDVFARDVLSVASLDPESVTAYHLRLSDNSGFIRRFSDPRHHDDFPAIYPTTLTMNIMARNVLTEAGYTECLVAWFSKRHGLHRAQQEKWRYGEDLLGLGVSAYSHLDAGVRFKNLGNKADGLASIRHYIDVVNDGKLPISEVKHLSPEEQMQGFVRRSLKTGIDREFFEQRYGNYVMDFFPVLEELAHLGVLTITPEEICLTEIGKLLPEEVAGKITTPSQAMQP